MGFLNMFYSFYWQGLRVDVNEAKKETYIIGKDVRGNRMHDKGGQDYQGNGDQLTPMEFLHV